MNKNFIETLLGAIVLIVAAYFLVYSTKTGDVGTGLDGYTLHAEFSDVGALKAGSDVRIGGVKIGSVSSLSLSSETYLAKVSMVIDHEIQLPEDTASRISNESLLGGAFLALEPGAEEDMINDGGRIRYNQDAQSLEKLLGQFIFSLKDAKDNEEKSDAVAPIAMPSDAPVTNFEIAE